jgi:hypothetical protein
MKNHEQKAVWLYRIIVSAPGHTLIARVVGIICLALAGQSTPEVLVALGSAAIGGPAEFLVRIPLNT